MLGGLWFAIACAFIAIVYGVVQSEMDRDSRVLAFEIGAGAFANRPAAISCIRALPRAAKRSISIARHRRRSR